MNRFQNVSFRDIGEFLDYLPPDELVLVEALRKLIFDTFQRCEERLSYNVPFYHGHSRMVFLWPGAVPWGGLRTPGVQLGFCKGYLLPSKELLNHGDRKEVYSLHFAQPSDIDVDFVRMMLMEALEADEQEHSHKQARKAAKPKDK